MWHGNMTVQEMQLAYIEQIERDLKHAKMMRDQWQKSIDYLEAQLRTLHRLNTNPKETDSYPAAKHRKNDGLSD